MPFFFLLLLFSGVNAAEFSRSLDLPEAKLIAISKMPQWQRLVHYESDSGGDSGLISAVLSDKFFLASNGQTNPLAELKATIEALAKPQANDKNAHAACRFPARFLWLREVLPTAYFQQVDFNCPLYKKWLNHKEIESVSLLYASGFLGNPASFYGHTLVKFNANRNRFNPLLDLTLNFGAIVPEDVGSVEYIIKGIFGGYDASFSHIQYYFHQSFYGDIELRDVWEYELNLTEAQVALIVGHAWELLDKRFTYYFFYENCGYQIAKLLEVVPELKALPDSNFWIFPQGVLQKVAQQNVKNQKTESEALIKQVRYHPSRQSHFYQKYYDLEGQQKSVLKELIYNKGDTKIADFQAQSTLAKIKVLDTLLDYYTVVEKQPTPKIGNTQLAKALTLAARARLPIATTSAKTKTPKSPHDSRSPSYASLSLVADKNSEWQRLQVRPSYYDELDSDSAHIDYSRLSMAELSFELKEEEVDLEYFRFIKVNAVNPRATGLPGDSNFAWNVVAGLERARFDCESCTVFRAGGDMGKSYNFNERAMMALYFGVAANDSRAGVGKLLAQSSTKFIYQSDGGFGIKAEAEYRRFLGGELREEFRGTITGRYPLALDWDLRLAFEHVNQNTVSLAVGHYW